MLLETEGLTKRFGGVTAVDEVSFSIEEGQLCSLIGPNGAGKTTLFNLITGTLQPTSGTIHLNGPDGVTDITDFTTDETAKMGIHRSYQITNIFPNSTVLENVRVAVQAHRGWDGWRLWRNVNTFDDHFKEAEEILERVGLDGLEHQLAVNLSHGEKRHLEVAIALAGDPDLVLMDEPTSGVSSEDVENVVELIRDIAGDYTVFLIEHNMDVVMGISDRVVVLHRGEMIADGTPDEIHDSEAVQEAYLGGYDESLQSGGTA